MELWFPTRDGFMRDKIANVISDSYVHININNQLSGFEDLMLPILFHVARDNIIIAKSQQCIY